MSKCLIYTDPEDGRTKIVHPAPQSRLLLPRGPGLPPELEPEHLWLQRIAAQAIPDGVSDVHVIEVKDLPRDRTYRDAWQHVAGKVSVHMGRARDVHRNLIREARKPLFAELDVAHLRAIESNDNELLATVAQAKQMLRDAPAHPDIEAAQTPEELKTVWPFPAKSPPAIAAPAPPAIPRKVAPASPGWFSALARNLDDGPAQPAADLPPAPELPPLPIGPTEMMPDPPPLRPDEPEPRLEPPAPELPPPPSDDAGRRRAARALIYRLCSEAVDITTADQTRYEIALQAYNGNVECMSLLAQEARIAGLSVKQLAERIIEERRARERRVSHVHTLRAHYLKLLEAATGATIDAIEREARQKIAGDA